jgi:hypothetical protein
LFPFALDFEFPEIEWPIDWPALDLSPLYNLVLFAIFLFAGIMAFRYVPGKNFRLIAGFGLIALGVAVLMGWLVVI